VHVQFINPSGVTFIKKSVTFINLLREIKQSSIQDSIIQKKQLKGKKNYALLIEVPKQFVFVY
jgi:hypothetical protein